MTLRSHDCFPLALSRRLCMAIALATAAAGTAPFSTAAATATTITYRIPAGPLDAALAAFATSAGISLSYDPALARAKHSAGLQGAHGIAEGLAQLLAGTGLQATSRVDGGYTLVPAPIGETLLQPVKVRSRGIDATTEGSRSYTAAATTIGKGQQKLKDIPQSVSVLTRQRMDDQNIESLPDVLNNVTGMTFSKSPGPGGFTTARGFEIGTLQYDGVPLTRNTYSLGSYATETTVFYDRVEVLRGAAGLLQGAGSPGGAINFVRKRGQERPTVTLTGKAGSWQRYGAQADIGGPLNDDGSLRGRAVVDYAKGDSFVDDIWSREQKLYGALDYDISPDTTVGIGAGYRKGHYQPFFNGIPRYSDSGDIGLSRSTFTGSSWNRGLVEQTTVYADFAHRFNNAWQFKATALNIEESNEATYQYLVGPVTRSGSGLRYYDFATDFRTNNLGLDVYLSGTFEALGMEHDTVLGANYSKYTTDEAFARLIGPPSFNVFAIDNHRPWQNFDSIAGVGSTNFSEYDVRQKGLYGTWRARLTEPLTLVLGARVSWYENTYAAITRSAPNQPSSSPRSATESNGHFTPYVGLIYALNPNWSGYASYSDVFIPQSQRTVDGSMLKPIEGSNYELGIKGELAEGRINTAFAVFRYDHENRAINDLASGLACNNAYCSVASGKIRSEGFEAELSGELAQGLQLFAGYAYTTTKFIEDLNYQDKIASTWTPRNSLRLWADYTLPGAWDRISLGAGLNTQSRAQSNDRQFDLAGFTVWNARIGYRINDDIAVALNANNVFDKTYYAPGYNTIGSNNYYGDPRNLMFTVKYTPAY